MVGDWVKLFDKYPAKVEAIGDTEVYLLDDDGVRWNVGYAFIKPIPLTPEILEKNGFVCSEKSSRKPYQFRDGYLYQHNQRTAERTILRKDWQADERNAD